MIGGFEYLRHDVLTNYLTMQTGNFYMTLLTFVLSYIFATWMFHHIKQMNKRLVEEQARRAVYEERERLANELHDNIAQTLFFLNVKLQKGDIEEAKSAVSDINNQVRQAIFNLRSSPDEGNKLSERIHYWLDEWSLITGIKLEVQLRTIEDHFTSVEEVQLFGLIQEAFTNIRKHSQASKAAISFNIEGNQWVLRITDNGSGLRSDLAGIHRYGMAMMMKRAEELHAHISIHNQQDGGVEIIVKEVVNLRKEEI